MTNFAPTRYVDDINFKPGPAGGFQQKSYTSFSGADIKVSFYVPPEKAFGLNLLSYSDILGSSPSGLYDGMINQLGGFLLVGNLATITVSSARSVSPVRSLGKVHVDGYTAGARTIAGSMIFSMLYRNAFEQIFRRSSNERMDEQFYVDMLPPFTVIIQARNESGHTGKQILTGVKLVNTGITYSVDDLFTEETYSYVAKFATPFIPDPEEGDVKEALDHRFRELLQNANLSAFEPKASALGALPARELDGGR